jgi:hypothetical protein
VARSEFSEVPADRSAVKNAHPSWPDAVERCARLMWHFSTGILRRKGFGDWVWVSLVAIAGLAFFSESFRVRIRRPQRADLLSLFGMLFMVSQGIGGSRPLIVASTRGMCCRPLGATPSRLRRSRRASFPHLPGAVCDASERPQARMTEGAADRVFSTWCGLSDGRTGRGRSGNPEPATLLVPSTKSGCAMPIALLTGQAGGPKISVG